MMSGLLGRVFYGRMPGVSLYVGGTSERGQEEGGRKRTNQTPQTKAEQVNWYGRVRAGP